MLIPPKGAPDDPGFAYFVKRGILYGAAVGMLLGLGYLAVSGGDPVAEIVLWRNFILVSGGVGGLLGVAVGLLRPKHRPDS